MDEIYLKKPACAASSFLNVKVKNNPLARIALVMPLEQDQWRNFNLFLGGNARVQEVTCHIIHLLIVFCKTEVLKTSRRKQNLNSCVFCKIFCKISKNWGFGHFIKPGRVKLKKTEFILLLSYIGRYSDWGLSSSAMLKKILKLPVSNFWEKLRRQRNRFTQLVS